MAREYTVGAVNQTLTGAVSLVVIRPGTTCALEVVRAWVAQSSSTTSAMQRVQLVRQVTAFPTVVAATPSKLVEGDPVSQIVGGTAAAAGTCGVNASAEGGGAKTVIFEDAFNVLNGWLWVPTPKDRVVCSPTSASTFSLFFPAAPASLTGWSFGVTFAELG